MHKTRQPQPATCSEQPRDVSVVELVPSCGVGLLDNQVLQEQLLLAVDNVLSSVEVDLVGGEAPALRDEHVPEKENDIQRNTEVGGDEGGIVETHLLVDDEDTIVLGQGDEDAEEEGDVAAPDTKRSLVWHDAVRYILRATGLPKGNVRDKDGDPGEDTKNGGQVDKVLKHLAAVVGSVHESQEGEDGAQAQRRPRHTAGIGLLEDGRGRTVRGKAVEGTTGNVQIRVGGGEDKDKDAGVDDVRKDADAGEVGGDDEGGGARAGTERALLVCEGEVGGVVGDNHTDKEDAEAVEEEDTVEGKLDSLGDAASRVLGLAGRDTNKLGTAREYD